MIDAFSISKKAPDGKNEDYLIMKENIFIIADGLGGHPKGDLASKYASEFVFDKLMEGTPSKDLVFDAMAQANFMMNLFSDYIEGFKIGDKSFGTTMELAYINGGRLFHGHIGDSRTYLFRKGMLTRLTKDHNGVPDGLIEEQEKEAIKGIQGRLTTYLGDEDPKIDVQSVKLKKRDIILMTTDGLTDNVYDASIRDVLIKYFSGKNFTRKVLIDPLKNALSELVKLPYAINNNFPCKDSITTMLLFYGDK